MKRTLAVVALLAMAALFHPVAAAAEAPGLPGIAPSAVRLIDVPYVPQSEALCGGAALAMLLRYWGDPAALASDFAPLLEPGAAGIRTDVLVSAVRARGWTARPVIGTSALMREELARGRPMIALVDAGHGALHYEVVVAWANGGVIAHDPAVGPYRVSAERAFEAAWARAGRWALLVLPPARPEGSASVVGTAAAAGTGDTIATADRAIRSNGDNCATLVKRGIAEARDGDPAGAALKFQAAAALCPDASAPWREMAGLKFGAEDWPGAARLAERAVAIQPHDELAWRLLAGSLFLAGDPAGALGAWNRVDEPRADLTRIDGLSRTRYRSVADPLDLPPGRLITPGAFLRAQRRLGELPTLSDLRLGVTPRAGGVATVTVAVVERPLLFHGPLDLAGAALGGVVDRAVTLNLAGPAGLGELWTAEYGAAPERPRVRLALAVPGVGGRPGLWRVEGLWERQAYAIQVGAAARDSSAAGIVRERRRRASLTFADWVDAHLRLEVGAALDRWTDRGASVSLLTALEARAARDRLRLRLNLAGWAGPHAGAPFGSAGAEARWRSHAYPRGAWLVHAGVAGVSARAPRALWPGAGTGQARAPLLRAHPLLDDGVLVGRAFGRTLWHGGIERQTCPWAVGPLRFGWAVFIDAARAEGTENARPALTQVDAGAGLRLGGLGRRGQLRVDVARGFSDGARAFSIGWTIL